MSSQQNTETLETQVDKVIEWKTIYLEERFGDFYSDKNNKKLIPYFHYKFYQTYGGGPVGGYIKLHDKICKAHFDIGNGWTITPLKGKIEIRICPESDDFKEIRFIEKKIIG